MKKIICVLLILTTILSCTPFTFADGTDNKKSDIEKETNLLKALYILPDDGITTEKLTRAEFAVYVTRMLGINDFAQNKTRYFYDVPMNHFALHSINSLLEKNVITIGDDKTFRPEDIITGSEACKMVVAALGYDEYAKGLGGYPEGYISVAANEEITKGVDIQNFTSDDAILIIYNALRANIFETTSIGSGVINKEQTDETVLSYYHDVFYGEGTLSAAKDERLYTDINIGENQVMVDGLVLDDGGKDYSDLIGSFVEYYYIENDNTEEIIYVVNAARNEDVVINIDDFDSFDGQSITYYEGTKKKTEKLTLDKVVVYNGEPLTENITETLKSLNYGEIVLKSSEDKSTYDIVIVNDYEDFYVTSKNVDEEMLADTKLSNSTIKLDEYNTVKLSDTAGNVMTLADVADNSMISVRKSKNKRIFKGIISSTLVTGKYEGVREDNGDVVILTINGKDYEVKYDYYEKIKETLTPGMDYSVVINAFDRVAYIKLPVEGGAMYGALIAAAINTDDETLSFKIYGEDGVLKRYTLNDKIVIDGYRYTGIKGIDAAIPGAGKNFSTVEPQIIRFEVKNDKIVSIDTYVCLEGYEDPRYTLTRKQPNKTVNGNFYDYSFYRGNRVGLDICVNANTKLFDCPEESEIRSASQNKFSIGQIVESRDYHGGWFYRLGTESTYYTAAMTMGSVSEMDAYIALIKDKQRVLDDESGEVITKLTLLRKGAETVHVVREDVEFLDQKKAKVDFNVDDLEKGDTIRIALMSNKISQIEMVYDISERYDSAKKQYNVPTWKGVDAFDNYYDGNYYHQEFMLSFGYVSEKEGAILKVGYKNADVVDEVVASPTHYMVYDIETKEAYIGSAEDVKDKLSWGDEYSALIYETWFSSFRSLVIYR